MGDILSDIENSLHERPNWQQKAAQRLIQSGKLHERDIQDLVALLKTPVEQQATRRREFHGLDQIAGSEALRLSEIGEVQGIENLSPDRPLSFENGNLTVTYDHNGSGKSGYTRNLKRACGVAGAAQLKANAFADPPETRKCKIRYRCGSQEMSIDWMAESQRPPGRQRL